MTRGRVCLLLLLAQQPAPIVGVVTDTTGLPLPGAVVTIKGSADLAVTDERGRFSVTTSVTSPVLLVEMSGFQSKDLAVKPDRPAGPIRITLEVAGLTDQVSVRAPAVGTPPDARLGLRPLDVVRTAGAQADIMRALAALPGVTTVDEGAGLFVRGGDVSETQVLLDGVVINHPYRYETPTGGFRGAVDPFLTQGISFATGGFSAEYGNSLSGVVDMHGLSRPAVPRVNVTAGLAGVSAGIAEPLGSKAGVRFAANRTTPQLLFAVNPSPREFDRLPGGWDLAGGLYYDSSTHGSFRLFAIDQRDHVGVRLEKDAFVGFLHSGAQHRLITALWQQPLSRTWSLTAAAGHDGYIDSIDVGVLAVDETDRERSLRVEAGGSAGDWTLRIGADAGSTRTTVVGRVPVRGGDFAGIDGLSPFDIAHRDWRLGVYVEAGRPIGRVTPTFGLRSDYFSHAATTRTDPRLNAAIDLGAFGRLRVAFGIYHQTPSPQYFDQIRGAARLAPMAATHYVVGYERGKIEGESFFRAEGYVKTYRQLPVEDEALGFSNAGYGHAHGVDVFLRRVWHFIDVRAGAGWVDTARRWASPEQRDRYPLPSGTWKPDFDVPYTGQLVINAPVSRTIAMGFAWRVAAGRPFTPVIGATKTSAGYDPIWGLINSDRLPKYQRFDLSVSTSRPLGSRAVAIFFASLDNVTGKKNFFEYAYSADYQERHPVAGASPRSVYVGCSITR